MGGIALAWVPLDGCVALLPWAAGSLGLGLYLQFKDQTWPAMGRVGFSFLALLLLGWPGGVSEVADGLARAVPDAAPTAGVDIATGLAGCGYAFPGALVGGAIAALIGRRSA